MAKLGGESTELLQISDDERARAARTAMLFTEEDLTRFLQIMLRSFDEMNYRQEPRFHLELGLLKLVHTQRLIPLEQLLSQMPGGAGNASRDRYRRRHALPRPQVPSASPAPLQRTAAPQQPRHRAASSAPRLLAADRSPRPRRQRSPPSRPSSPTRAANPDHPALHTAAL